MVIAPRGDVIVGSQLCGFRVLKGQARAGAEGRRERVRVWVWGEMKRLPVLKMVGVGLILVTAFCFVALLNIEVRRVEWTHMDSSDHPLH